MPVDDRCARRHRCVRYPDGNRSRSRPRPGAVDRHADGTARVRALVEPAAPGQGHDRGADRRPRGGGGRRGPWRSTSTTTGWCPTTASSLGFVALGDDYLESDRRVLARPPRRRPHAATASAVLPPQISLATQIPQAAGLAWGLALRSDPGIVCAFIGDGATSEGDFYEGLNLAGVQHAPLHRRGAQQRMGHLHAHQPPDGRVELRGQGRGRRRARRAGRRQRRARGASTRRDARAGARAPARARWSSSSSPTGRARTRTPTTPRATSRRTSSPRGSARDPIELFRSHLAATLDWSGRRSRTRARSRRRSAAGAHHRRGAASAGRHRSRASITSLRDRERRASREQRADLASDGHGRRRRPRRAMLVASREHAHRDPRHDRGRDGARRPRRPARRGRRPQRWRVPRHRRAASTSFGDTPRLRHADRRGCDRRRHHRPVGGGLRARRRDPVRRLQRAGVPPDHRRSSRDAVPQPGPVPVPGHRARAVRRRRADARAPRRLGRGAVRAHPGAEGRGPVDGRRRRGAARRARSAIPTRCCSSSRSPSTAARRRRPRGRAPRRARARARRARARRRGDHRVGGDGRRRVRGRRRGRRAPWRARSVSSTSGRCRRSTSTRSSGSRSRPGGSSWCTRRRSPPASAPKSWRRSRRRRSSRWRPDPAASPGTTSRAPCRWSRTGADPMPHASSLARRVASLDA